MSGAYDYGELEIGASASQTFTLTNTGGKATRALSVALTGADAFAITADTCTGTAIGPGKSCQVTVAYAPLQSGDDSATLSVSGTNSAVSASLALSGSGAAVRHLYWTNFSGGTIGRANLDGSNPNQNFITGATNPIGLAVDAGHIYWANTSGGTIGVRIRVQSRSRGGARTRPAPVRRRT